MKEVGGRRERRKKISRFLFWLRLRDMSAFTQTFCPPNEIINARLITENGKMSKRASATASDTDRESIAIVFSFFFPFFHSLHSPTSSERTWPRSRRRRE